MSTADFAVGGGVGLLACVSGAIELIGRNPEFTGLVFTTRPGRRYLLVNGAAGLLAFSLALLLQMRFREPETMWRLLVCGLGAMAVLRSAPVTRSPAAGPARLLQRLQRAYGAEIDEARRVRNAREVGRALDGLTWETDKEALAMLCLSIAERDTDTARDRMAKRMARSDRTDLPPGARLFSLALALRTEFGMAVLYESAATLRRLKAESLAVAS